MKIKTILLLVISIILISTTVYAATVEITADNLNVRKEASTSSEAFDVVEKGDVLSVIEELDGWYKISTDNGEGYISSDYAKKLNDATSTTTVDTTVAGYTYDKTEIKIIPLINAQTIGKVTGDYKVIERVGNWSFIENGSISGWILTKDVTPTPANEEQKQEEEPKEQEETKTEEEEKTEEPEEQKEEEKPEEKQEETKPAEPETTFEAKTMYVTGDSVFVRKGPGTSYESITRLTYRTDVTVTGESSGWYKVKYSGSNGDIEGYMSSDYLSETKPAEKTSRSAEVARQEVTTQESAPAVPSSFGNDLVAYAKNYLGKPYVYGGSGPNSFDCSGFTMFVYNHFGYSLPHGATSQSRYGTYVSKENLQPGDLVFFLDFETMDGIGHVGIYVGGGDFIHASSGSAHAVTISNINSGSYASRYYTARRLN